MIRVVVNAFFRDSEKPLYTHHKKQTPHLSKAGWIVEGPSC